MKNKDQIQHEIEHFETLLLQNKTKYNQLSQVCLLSGEGSQIRKTISQLEGKIEALKWVIKGKNKVKNDKIY